MCCQLIDKKKAKNKSTLRMNLLTKKRTLFVNKSLKLVNKIKCQKCKKLYIGTFLKRMNFTLY
jgi:hypothetical protein